MAATGSFVALLRGAELLQGAGFDLANTLAGHG
jgi:hypothetical protein